MPGSVLAPQLHDLVENIQDYGLVLGHPGQFTLSLMYSVAAAGPRFEFTGAAPRAEGAAPPPTSMRLIAPLTPGQAGMADTAVKKSNVAALATPSASSGAATTASTPISIITSILSGLPTIGATPGKIHDFEAGTKATLHWWGWSLDMNETATAAFKWLLDNDLEGLTAAAAGLLAVSAPLAAAGAILTAAAKGLSGWITAADTKGLGVTISGYLWIGIDVTGNSAAS